MTLRAVLPAHIRRRWDAMAVQQLAERAAALENENEDLRRWWLAAEQHADFWRENAEGLAGSAPGMTVAGRLVRSRGYEAAVAEEMLQCPEAV